MDFIRRSGATVLPKYGIMETGPVGYGCLNRLRPTISISSPIYTR